MNKKKPIHKRKLWVLLRSLTDQERKKLESYICCELGETHPDAVKLFKNIPGNRTRELLWASTFKGSPYKDTKFRKLCFQLTSTVEQFIAVQGFLKDQQLKDLIYVRELNRREGDDKLFIPAFKAIWNKLNSNPLRGAPYHKMQYELLREQFHYQIKHVPKHKRQHIGGVHYSFDLYWLHEKIILAISSLNHKQIGYQEVATFLQDELLEKIEEQTQYMNNPTLTIFKDLYRLITGKSTSAENLIVMVRENQNQFDEETYNNIYLALLNYYIREANKERSVYHRSRVLELYVWGIEERLLFIDGFLPSNYFRGIIALGCQLSRFDLVEIYLEDYLEFLPPEDQDEARLYNLAKYHYSKNNYAEASQILINRFKNLIYEADGKSTLYICQYEMNRTDNLERDLRSFKIYLKNNKKLPANFNESLLTFTIYFEKLVRSDSLTKLMGLYQNVKETQAFTSREWLMKQIKIKLQKYPRELVRIT